MTRRIPPSAAIGFLAIAALLGVTVPGSAQVPTPPPNGNGWHNEPFTVTFGMNCVPPERDYPDPADPDPDTASGSLTSACTDPADPNSSQTVTYDVRYDATRPTANPSPSESPHFNGWYNHPIDVNLNWNAAVSGQASGPNNCPQSLRYSGGTEMSTCSDLAGNVASASVFLPNYDDDPPTVSITGSPPDPDENRTPTFSFVSEQGATFKCQLDADVYEGCHSPWQPPPPPLGDGPHTFSVSAIDQAGNPSAFATRIWTVAERPKNTSPPVIVGVAAEAETLSADNGAWSGGTPPVNFATQWQRCDADGTNCNDISGSNAPQYVVQTGDVGHRLRFEVRATNLAGEVLAHSTTDVVTPLDRNLPQSTISRRPANPTNKRTATFTFAASRLGSTFHCKLDARQFESCSSPKTYSGLAVRTHTFQVRAIFVAKNGERFVEDTPAAAIWRIDVRRPPAPSFVKLRPGDNRISLSWIVARVADIRGTRVVRTRVRRPGVLIRVLARSRLTDGSLRNGALYRYALRTVDKAGNFSPAKVIYGRPRDPLVAPRDGAVVTRPPLLRWLARPHATYYNLQLYRVRRGPDLKMLTTWPIRPSYQLRQRWRFAGRRVLRPGMYRWYVWPGFGSFAENRFGRLIGTSVFTKR